jgi:hypothetical protein
MEKMEKRGREEHSSSNDVLAIGLFREGRKKNGAACIGKKNLTLFTDLSIK